MENFLTSWMKDSVPYSHLILEVFMVQRDTRDSKCVCNWS